MIPPSNCNMSDLPAPVDEPEEHFTAHLVALAQTASPQAIREYEPTRAVRALAGAFFTRSAPDFEGLAEEAGISRSTLYRAMQDPAAIHWIVSHGSNIAGAALGAVHARLLHLALRATGKGDTAVLRLFMERFDPEFKKQRVLEHGQNIQNNSFVSEMSDAELGKWVKQQRTRILGQDERRDASDVLPVDRTTVRGSGGQETADADVPTVDPAGLSHIAGPEHTRAPVDGGLADPTPEVRSPGGGDRPSE